METLEQLRIDDALHQRAEMRDFAHRKGLDRIAAIHTGEALHAAWEAYLSGFPMTWLGSRP